MAKLGGVGAAILSLVVVGRALVCGAAPAGAGTVVGQSTPTVLVAVDVDTSGNDPRTVGTVDDCVSATVDQPVDIDIVVPNPGIPADRGMTAYQFSILYDPAVVWIAADDSDMLLAQATGSNVIPIADPKPDSNGVYQSWGVDFGASGIEPAGASETGPGVIARISLMPQGEGISPLILSNVLLIDDASERISLGSVQSATIHVGEPCSEPSQDGGVDNGQDGGVGDGQDGGVDDGQDGGVDNGQDGGVDNGQDGGVADDGDSGMQQGAADGVNDDGDTDANGVAAGAAAAPSSSPAGAVPTAGGAPPPAGGTPTWFVVSGLIATLGGASLLIAGKLAFRPRTRRDTSPQQD